MKKLITRLTALVLVLTVVACACPLSFAESVIRVDDIQYVIDGNKASVYKYVGNGGKVSIKSKVNGVTVTSIGNYAFAEDYENTDKSKRITEVSIPQTVKTIGKGAFMECTSLKSVELPIGLTTLGDTVFWYCESLKSVAAYPDLKIIGEKVFYGCPKLTIYCGEDTVIEKYAKSNKIKVQSFNPTSLKLNKSSVTLNKGETYTVKATVEPSDGYYNELEWTSNNTSVATVNKNGKITAKKYGTAKITCCTVLGDLKKTVTVNVKLPKMNKPKSSNRTYSSYTLKWEEVSGADGYTLQKYENGEWKTVKTTNATKYTFKNLKQGTDGTYRVRAYAKQGSETFRGAWSESVTVSTKSVGRINGLKVASCTSKSIKLSWDKATNADGYEIYLYNAKTEKYEKIYTTSKNYYTHEGLTSGTKYSYRVRAYVKSGETKIRGYYSSLAACTSPSKVSGVRSASATKSTLTVKWNSVKNATGYQIKVSGKNYEKSFSTTKTSYKITGLEKKSKYTVKVRAYVTASDKKYYGSYSDSATLSTNYIPSSVTDIVEEFNDALSKTSKAKELYSTKLVGTTAKITEKNFSDKASVNTVKALLDSFTGTHLYSADIKDGKVKSTGEKTSVFLTGNEKPVALSASSVKNASYVKDGSGYFVTLELKSESVKNTALPKANSAVAPMIDWEKIKSDCSPDAKINSVTTKYTGSTVKGKINKSGKFDTLFVSAPFTATLGGKVNGKTCNMTIEGKKTLDLVITWW